MDKAYSRVIALIEEFRKIDPEMPLQTAVTFCTVAAEEGITMKRLQEKLGFSQSSCSRNVASLSKFHRLNKPGHDLLYTTEDPHERRRKIVMLTPKGKRVAESIKAVFED